MPTPILQLPLVSPNQNQKETTINTALAIIEAAGNDARVIDGTGNPASITLGDVNFTRYLMQKVQNHTAAITVKVPAYKRFFVVANEGTANVTFYPNGGTAIANGSAVGAGKIVLMMSDGVNVRALTSGVSRLQDLTDVVTAGATDTQVLAFIQAEGKWRPATIAEALSVGFLGLNDTPSSYTGQAGKLARVKTDLTGMEFVAPAALGISFTDLEGVPESLTNNAGKIVAVNDDSTALIFTDAPPLAFNQLTDTPESYVGQGGKVVRVKTTEDGIEFATGGSGSAETFLDLTDAPDAYTGEAGKVPVVNSGETGLEFVPLPDAGADTFLELTDTPAAYTGAAGKVPVVNSGETGLEFVPLPVGGGSTIDTFLELTDTPAAYTGASGKVAVVNTGETGLEFVPLPSGATGALTAHRYWRVRAFSINMSILSLRELEFRATVGGATQTTGGTALASSSFSGTTPANAFDGAATEWSSNTGDVSSGDGAWIGYQFAAPVSVREIALTAHSLTGEGLRAGFVEYSDDGVLWRRAWRLPAQTAWTAGQQRIFAFNEEAEAGFLDLPDTPPSYNNQANKRVTVKSDSTGLQFIDDTFLNLADTPSSYSGMANRKLRVNNNGTLIEFVVDNQAANVTGTKAAAYTPALTDAETAQPVIPVNVAADTNVTLPPNSSVAFPVGTMISVIQMGAGKVGFAAGAGVTINKPASLTAYTRQHNSLAMALKIAADTWVLLGDLGAAP